MRGFVERRGFWRGEGTVLERRGFWVRPVFEFWRNREGRKEEAS